LDFLTIFVLELAAVTGQTDGSTYMHRDRQTGCRMRSSGRRAAQ